MTSKKRYMPSFSALAVIYCLNALARHKRWHSLVAFEDVGFFGYCLKHYSRYSRLLALIYRLPEAWCVKVVELSLAYGAPQHFAFRKKYIRTVIEQAKADGIVQYVNIGAGFDMELLRAANDRPDLLCLELDTPLMVPDKQKLLAAHYKKLPCNYVLLDGDLAADCLSDCLTRCDRFNSRHQTLFILEGVSMYLSKEEMIRLLSDMRALSVQGSCLVMTALEPEKVRAGGLFSVIGKWLLSSHQERYGWRIAQDRIDDFLGSSGFEIMETVSYAGLQRDFRDEHEMSVLERQCGEYIISAKIG